MSVKCEKCGVRVRDNFQSKWRHLTRFHPDVVASRILPLLADPERFTQIGRKAGEFVQNAVRRILQ